LLSPMRRAKVRTNSHKERRAKAARRSSRSLAQGLRSEDSPKKCRQATPSRQPPAWMLPAQRCAPPCPAKTAGHGVAQRQAARCGGCRPCDPAKRKPSGITRGLVADFFGAIPVASALGAAAGATPPRRFQIIMGVLGRRLKPELSTLLESGTFYFALTDFFSPDFALPSAIAFLRHAGQPIAAGLGACPSLLPPRALGSL
jgi:hypothetical protein